MSNSGSRQNTDERDTNNGRPVKIDRHRQPIDSQVVHGGFNPPPQGKKTVFGDYDDGVPSSNLGKETSRRHWEPNDSTQADSKRDWDHERERGKQRTYSERRRPERIPDRSNGDDSVQERHEDHRHDRGHDRPTEERDVGQSDRHKNYEEVSTKRRRIGDSTDELDFLGKGAQETSQPNHSISPPQALNTVVPSPSKEPSGGLFDLGKRAFGFLSGVNRDAAGPATDPNAAALQELAQVQSELKYCQEQLAYSSAQYKAQEEQMEARRSAGLSLEDDIARLRDEIYVERAEKGALVRESEEMANRLDRARRRIEELEQQSTGYRDRHDTHESNKQQLALDRANARIAELERQIGGNESRIQSLVVERGQLHAQLKQQQRSANNRPSADKIPMDIFENTADQVSEASLQSAVESLNDSVDTLILGLVDTAEQLVGERHPEFGVPPETQDQKLFAALAAHCESEEKRGFLLEALCHDYIIGYLSALFFAGEAAPRLGRKALILERILVDLTESVPWSVVQRWRSISSESVSRLLVPKARNHLESLAITIADVFTWAYQQPVETFHAAAFKTQLDSLAAIFDDALKLATTVRRDVLSVRMSIVCPEQDDETNYPPYDSRSLNAVWPDMGVVEGDEVIGLFHLGLQRRTEQGRVSLLVKPQVTTAALLREMSKES